MATISRILCGWRFSFFMKNADLMSDNRFADMHAEAFSAVESLRLEAMLAKEAF